MTPNNILNMAKLAGLNAIAISDHNSCKNCPAAFKVAKNVGITYVPSMELTTAEECHVLCLFDSLDGAMAFDKLVESKLPPIKNRADVFGPQYIKNSRDETVEEFPYLLTNATSISIEEIKDITASYDGIAIPAHINRPSNSVMAMLGAVPDYFSSYEVSPILGYEDFIKSQTVLNDKHILMNSDAHSLHLIEDANKYFELEKNTPKAIINHLRN